jgi:hypothetical protein
MSYYPEECPVFRHVFSGQDVQVVDWWVHAYNGLRYVTICPQIDDFHANVPVRNLRPLTRSARTMLKEIRKICGSGPMSRGT